MNSMPSFVKKTLRIRGSRHSALDTARSRVAMISVVFVLAYILVAVRVFDLTIIQGHRAVDRENGTVVAAAAPETFRADIVDRNGVILATSLDTASLFADPALVPDPEQVARELTDLFPDLVYGDTLQRLQRKGRFVWLKRNLTPHEQYQVLELGHPGLDFKTERRRIYPQGPMAAHMVGYTDVDGNGLAGVERSFNRLLEDNGEPLAMTIDIRLQHILRRELLAAVNTYSGKGGAGVIVDIAGGDVLAAVSLPDFDPHDPGAAGPQQLFNNVTLGVYELGSTFKIFSTAALLEFENVGMDYTFNTTEPLKRGRFKISDYHPEKRPMNVPEVFMHSSNIGAALMGEMVGTQRLKDFYQDLGLMDKMAFEIDEVGTPIVPGVWRDINTLTASYGHGIAVTPLQMVMAASSIANGGIAVQPTLIKSKNDNKADAPQKDQTLEPELRIVSPQTAHRMRQLMRLVVTDGTGTNADVPGYSVGGKTGTAEKPGPKGGYDRRKKISSFLGFFPMEAPRYAVFVMVDEPKGTKESFGYATGGWVAAPAVGKIISAMAGVLGIPPTQAGPADDIAASLKRYVDYKPEGDPLASH
ncbi:MAG: penicillin-binding protein 2 [Rhodospirillales bacterium]|nr:penicillin-binding protein 2 [Rhodospirillales bacterium]MCB9996701.1 penicillin-binding protein 2 [Rhodospirillales bacterium]